MALCAGKIGAPMDGELPGRKGFLKLIDNWRAVVDPIDPTAIGTTYLVVIGVS